MFEPDGLFAHGLPGFEYRPQQVEMLQAVAGALNRKQHLLVEAGTGTGKSLAYLLPAVTFAHLNGERVVVSTNTINLQDQLFQKDIPDLQKLLPFEFRAAVLKGRSNYLCQRRLSVLRQAGVRSPEEMRMLARVLVWLPSTQTGERDELFMPDLAEQALWGKISAESDTCTLGSLPLSRAGTLLLLPGQAGGRVGAPGHRQPRPAPVRRGGRPLWRARPARIPLSDRGRGPPSGGGDHAPVEL